MVQATKPLFFFQAVAPEDVLKHLSTFNVWKAPGIDGICHRLLKNCAQVLSSSLCHIFNISLQTGVFPKTWKTALIQPIFKNKGKRSDARNYRPIALLPSVSKVFNAQTQGRRERKRKGKEEDEKEREREKGKGKLEVKLWQKRKKSQTPQPGIEPGTPANAFLSSPFDLAFAH